MIESITRKPVAFASKQSLSAKQHPVLVRLGRYVVLSVGTITVVITFAFLSFLWTDNGNSYAWRNIMIHAWAPRAITISALIIRVCVVAQAGVCTSMLAALALEHFEVLYTEAAGVSSIRYSHTGPESLFVRLAKGTRVLGPTKILFDTGTPLIITAVSQFSSTALLADLRLDLVLGNYNTVDVHYGYNESRVNEVESTFRTESYWKGRPFAYAAFAEYSEDPYVAEGVSDTGLSLRAFLPFTSGTARSLLSSYIGIATVVDTRVTCIRPGHFKALVEPYSEGDNLAMTGSINASTTSPKLQSLASTPVPFNCSIPLVTNGTFSISDTPQDATE